MPLDGFFRIVRPPMVISDDGSAPFIPMMIGFVLRPAITGCFLKMPLAVPIRIIVVRPWFPVMGEGNTGTEKYQSGSDQNNFLDIRLHKYSPFSVRF
jgi:hypothetical protein